MCVWPTAAHMLRTHLMACLLFEVLGRAPPDSEMGRQEVGFLEDVGNNGTITEESRGTSCKEKQIPPSTAEGSMAGEPSGTPLLALFINDMLRHVRCVFPQIIQNHLRCHLLCEAWPSGTSSTRTVNSAYREHLTSSTLEFPQHLLPSTCSLHVCYPSIILQVGMS